MASVTVASLNIRGVPLTGSPLSARCRAIGAFFEASDTDVACFQEVLTYYHLAQLRKYLPSFRQVSYRGTLAGPRGGVVTMSRLPVSSSGYHSFGRPPRAPGIPRPILLRASLKGALVTQLADPELTVVTTHPIANWDGDWSPANRFYPLHRAQLAALTQVIAGVQGQAVVCGDFNVDRDSALFTEFMKNTGLADVFNATCPPTFRAEYLPTGSLPHCIDFILTKGAVKPTEATVLFRDEHVSDHLGLRATLSLLHLGGRGQGAARLDGGRVRGVLHLRRLLAELIESRIDPDQREFALDDGQLGTPHVREDSPQVTGGVIPPFTRRPGPVGPAAHGNQDSRGARQQRAGRAVVRGGDDQVDPGLDVLGDAEVVQRHREQHLVRGGQLARQLGSKRDCGALGLAAVLFWKPCARYRVRPCIRRQRIGAYVTADHRVTGVGLMPLRLHDVGDRATG
jgi:endonuclease/exonuclease/phosphatase family metal-dependent hydrolase